MPTGVASSLISLNSASRRHSVSTLPARDSSAATSGLSAALSLTAMRSGVTPWSRAASQQVRSFDAVCGRSRAVGVNRLPGTQVLEGRVVARSDGLHANKPAVRAPAQNSCDARAWGHDRAMPPDAPPCHNPCDARSHIADTRSCRSSMPASRTRLGEDRGRRNFRHRRIAADDGTRGQIESRAAIAIDQHFGRVSATVRPPRAASPAASPAGC